jgi:hypothetical protein
MSDEEVVQGHQDTNTHRDMVKGVRFRGGRALDRHRSFVLSCMDTTSRKLAEK